MWSLILTSVIALSPPEFRVQPLGGDAVAGPIVELSAQRVTVQTSQGPVSLETRELAHLARSAAAEPSPRSAPVVTLADGSQVVAAEYAVSGGQARITRPGGDVTELPIRDVATVQLQPQTETIAAEWSRLVESEVDGDLLVIRRGDSIEYHRGTLGEVTQKTVQFTLDGELLPVSRAKVQGLVYYRSAGRSLPEAACWISEEDGSRWAAVSLGIEGQGETLRWTTPLGLEVVRPAAGVVRIDFSEGKIIYLSDLEPESMVWTPYFHAVKPLPALARFFAPREDRGLDPGPLELEGKQYQKGLALRSRTTLVYRLPGPFRRLKAVVGIDDRVRPQGHVRLVIRGDDRLLLETTIAGTDPAQPIDLDLGGCRRLSIVVDYGDDLDLADHLDLCDARLVK